MQTPAHQTFFRKSANLFDNIEINNSPDLRIGDIGTGLTGLNTDNKIRPGKIWKEIFRIVNNDDVELLLVF